MRRLTRGIIEGLVYASGLEQAIGEGDVLPSLVALASMCHGMYIHDKALVYAEIVRLLENESIPIPEVTESLFFDRMTQEIANGWAEHQEGESLRTQDRTLAQQADITIGGLGPESGGDPGRQHGRRPRQDRRIPVRDKLQTREETEPIQGIEGGRRGGDYF